MTTLDIIAALMIAVKANDTTATARLLDQLEARLPLDEVIDLLEAIVGETPATTPALPLVACA